MDGQSKLIARLQLLCGASFMSILILFFISVTYIVPANLEANTSTDWAKIGSISTASGLLPAWIAAIATACYAYFFFRLQKELNSFNEHNAKDNRLIEISTQWNSLEFVRSRNRAWQTIVKYQGDKSRMYNELCQHDRLDDWIDISLVAHFIERLGRLLADGQIDAQKTSAEFAETVVWWSGRIIPLYEGDDDEVSIVKAIKAAAALVERSDLIVYSDKIK